MGALDKLNNRIQQDEKKEEKAAVQANAGTIGNRIVIPARKGGSQNSAETEKRESAEVKKPEKKAQNKKKTTPKKPIVKNEAEKKVGEKETTEQKNAVSINSKPVAVSSKKMGRKPTRGIKDVDYKMLNIAVPMEVYENLMASYGGNLTYHINSILREAVEKQNV